MAAEIGMDIPGPATSGLNGVGGMLRAIAVVLDDQDGRINSAPIVARLIDVVSGWDEIAPDLWQPGELAHGIRVAVSPVAADGMPGCERFALALLDVLDRLHVDALPEQSMWTAYCAIACRFAEYRLLDEGDSFLGSPVATAMSSTLAALLTLPLGGTPDDASALTGAQS